MILRIQPEDIKIDTLVRRFRDEYFKYESPAPIEIEEFSGGTDGAVERFKKNLIPELKNDPHCYLMLAVDYDKCSEERQQKILDEIDAKYHCRVFILTFKKEAENFLSAFKASKNPKNFNTKKVGEIIADLLLNKNSLDREQKRKCERWKNAEQNHLVCPEQTIVHLCVTLETLRG